MLFIDASSTQHSSYGKSKFWFLVMDHNAMDYCWLLSKSKDKTAKVMIDLVKHLKDVDRKIVKIIDALMPAERTRPFRNSGLHFEYMACKTT